MSITPVILCGGAGSRMWPLSRSGYPKQFLSLFGEQSLLQQTATRLCGLPNIKSPIVISNNEQRFLVSEQLREAGVEQAQVVLEPIGRNTAPAVAAAALIALEKEKDAILIVLPSDHVILHNDVFRQLIMQAKDVATEGHLVTLGVPPTQAHTGYGYIKKGDALTSVTSAFAVSKFIEKPNATKAEEFFSSNDYYWNSGMFVFRADVYLREFAKLQPQMLEHVTQAVEHAERDLDFIRLEKKAFSTCPSNSIDYAIMEHTQHAAVLAANNLGWSDIGSWDALACLLPMDVNGNNVVGDVVLENTKNCYLHSEGRMLAAVGIENIVVVETADAVLVAQKDKVQDVKRIVEKLNITGRSESIDHRKVYRPWGSYERIDAGARFQVKRIIVNPGASLSSQMHYHRAEHWIVVKGTARVFNGDKEILLTENQSTYIPIGATHRLENPGKFPLELIEVQSGGYLGEDDIVRFEDVYGRVTA
ncbi:mannose-1-phosphate guanylyltransferase/mannose-6-phosphate isomerase [Legionella lytica]|uniref:mannose-1-phosphate guanylyltransferase n=1 Tax=Legionella lytica TaxID=96232 RepID=A0ABW8DA81_9GAMM